MALNPASALVDLLQTPSAVQLMDTHVLVSQRTGPQDLEQSTEYRWDDFVPAFEQMATEGIAGNTFQTPTVQAGLVNIALFLAQCMQETIQYNACDENNWSLNLGVPNYPLTASCGQAGQDYSQYKCSLEQEHMECPVDPRMALQATTQATWGGAPPRLFCAPTDLTGDVLGRWDYTGECGPAGYKEIPEFPDDYIAQALLGTETCNAYEGQFSGKFTMAGCNPNLGCPNTNQVDTTGGKIHYNVEGCCWWGRGVIQTTGPCNMGKLNYYLAGRQYNNDGSSEQWNPNTPFAGLDFCTHPNVICDGPKELRWISGMFYWLNDVQAYQNSNYNFDFASILTQDAETIFNDPSSNTAKSLVDATSGLVNRGCPASSCPGSGNVHALTERFRNFQKALTALKHIYNPNVYPAPAGAPAPPSEGAWYSPKVMCQSCAVDQCAIRWSKNGAVSCAGWVGSEAACRQASSVAAIWCDNEVNAPSHMTPMPTVAPSAHSTPSNPTPFTSTPTEQPSPIPTPSPVAPTTAAPSPESATTTPAPTLTTQEECANCFGNTSGPCQQLNGVCWEYLEAATKTCPVDTAPCKIPAPTPTATSSPTTSAPTVSPTHAPTTTPTNKPAFMPTPSLPPFPLIPDKKPVPASDSSKDGSKLFGNDFDTGRGNLKKTLRRRG